MRADDRVRLVHMREAANDALTFMSGHTREDLDRDRMLVYAVIRAVEIVGEAAGKVSDELRLSAPAVPWVDIIGMRHRLIHAYHSVNLAVLWKTVQSDLPELITELDLLLK